MTASHEPGRAVVDAPAAMLQRVRVPVVLLEAVHDSVRVGYANPAAGELLGCEPEALRGARLDELISPETDVAAFNGLRRAVGTAIPPGRGS